MDSKFKLLEFVTIRLILPPAVDYNSPLRPQHFRESLGCLNLFNPARHIGLARNLYRYRLPVTNAQKINTSVQIMPTLGEVVVMVAISYLIT
jgi:hypothetical protein